MTVLAQLISRTGERCELCGAATGLQVLVVPPHEQAEVDTALLACTMCRDQIEAADDALDVHHWRCLNDSMWSTLPAVQVMAWRMLNRLSGEDWAANLLGMLYLDDETLAWAQNAQSADALPSVVHKDTNGAILSTGDTVTLVKDLKVKGAGFTAKRGTAVRNISLVPDNDAHIEGRVEGQKIVILCEFVKRAG
ncbi:MAG: hypothetical protein COA47_02030 [Robiginitomaculum sp.]|nr:MAG: hypothetical protein COA47_02030 [Robiginitomaculum sp.]